MTRDDLLRKVAGLACASLFDVKERLANDIDTHDASQRALIEQQAKEITRLREALELYRRASYQSHSGHWDKTGGGGAGCPVCLESRDLRNQAEQALRGGEHQ